ncbi:hypothetical protein SAMN05421505_11295 [Sinosporangium album]|uniref:Uncharacterized protein n=1 Tax=Sinosporangium album TaxID=504805 RepID=A0A1G8AC48_9ACTN|nr:hypothetical protein [Sinosporangium album]SDH18416.1 hypothetical protein SAMN05421505_11295 [Sinosporangium album]
MSHPVADHDGVRVLASQCSTCIFRPGNLMKLAPGRLREMVNTAIVAEGGHIICHDTLPYSRYETAEAAICRGFWNRYRKKIPLLSYLEQAGWVREISRPED